MVIFQPFGVSTNPTALSCSGLRQFPSTLRCLRNVSGVTNVCLHSLQVRIFLGSGGFGFESLNTAFSKKTPHHRP